MFLRPTEACILLLLFFQTGYSFKKQLCSNAYMTCAHGVGICKPECMKDEERIGFCHGDSCRCCKTPQPGGSLNNYILADEATIYDEEESWDNYKSRNRNSNSMRRAFGSGRGGGGGWGGGVKGRGRGGEKGRGGGGRGALTDFMEGVRCEFDGNLYADGAEWTLDCMEHKCVDGHVSSMLSHNCCEFEEKKYCDGDTWSQFCTVYSCWHGHVDSKDDDHCCEHEGKMYLSGDSWTEGCYDILCHMGKIKEKKIASCCEDNRVLYESGQTWTETCDHFKCNNGMIERSDVTTCCSGLGGVMKQSGETWRDGCMDITCRDGRIEEKIAPALCCEHEGDLKDNGATWQSECDMHTCINSLVNTVPLPHACCLIERTAKMVKDGEIWFEDCFRYKCMAPNISKMVNSNACCVDDSIVYEESATVFKNECEVHECKCTEAGCSLLMTDDSKCEKEDLKGEVRGYENLTPTYTTRTPIKDRLYQKLMEKLTGGKQNGPPEENERDEYRKVYNKLLNSLNKYKRRPVPHMACRYNNMWMLHDTTLIEECFKIICDGGCTCYEMLQHGCCYNDDTEHKDEGEIWEENCIVYTCLNGEISTKNSTSTECCLNKIKGCMYGGMEYSIGETIAYGCSIHQCEMGRFVSYPDPACCVVDGSAYPSGSKWQDECFTYICDMGLIKKSNREICKETCKDSCHGSQVEFQIQIQQMQQPQPCQSCCMVGEITVHSGQTWMDNCNAHSCNQGTISISPIANCK